MYTNEKASQLPPRRKKWGPLSQFVSVTIILRIGRVLSGSVLPVHLTHLASALCYNGHRGVLSDPNILFVDPVRSNSLFKVCPDPTPLPECCKQNPNDFNNHIRISFIRIRISNTEVMVNSFTIL